MKNFFKIFFPSFVAGLLLLILTIVFVIVLIGSALSKSEEPVSVDSNSILKLSLNKPIVDRSNDNTLSKFNFGSFGMDETIGLDKLLIYIDKAATDSNIKGIYLDVTTVAAGWATVDEIRNALIKFRKSGKFIISYSDIYDQKAYYLASVANKVCISPQGIMLVNGLASGRMFFKKALDKLGIEAVVIRHGKFKSYVEPYILDKMSDENRLQTMTYLNSIWKHVLTGIATERKIDADSLNLLVNEMAIRNPETAVKYRLVDSLMYKDEILTHLANLSGNTGGEPKFISFERYAQTAAPRTSEGLAHNKIAVVYFSGEIVIGEGNEENIGADRFCKALREARADSSIKAVVIRVNSGGGSALASESIWREVALTRKVKPVIASFGDVAASGGYYLAAEADTILASPVTITGSIGVFGLLVNTEKLMSEKLGINYDVAKTNPHADLGNPMRKMSDQEKEVLQQNVESMYTTFVKRVSDGRKLTTTYVDSIGQGRVWAGSNALSLKLIDGYAGLDSAIRIAAHRAKITDFRTVALPKQKDPLEELMKKLSGEPSEKALKVALGEWYSTYTQLQSAAKQNGIYARIPYEIDIH
jgi:protease-4